jgi:hypothetical protein
MVVIPPQAEGGAVLSIVREEGAPVPVVDAAETGESGQPIERSAVQALLLEVTRSLEAYRARDPGARVDHAVVSGDVGVEEALVEAIQTKLNVTAECYNPASSFGWSAEEGAAAAAFSATLGLVLGQADEDALQFDFLHPKRTVTRAEKQLKKAPMAAAVVLLFLAAAGVAVARLTKEDRQKLAAMEKRIAELNARADDNEKFLKYVDDVRRFDAGQPVWVDLLLEVVALLPSASEFVVNQLDMSHKEVRIILRSRSKTREAATNFVKVLNEHRREDRPAPRFKATMGQQSEKKGEKYPFSQDISVVILDDTAPPKGASRKSGSR